MQTPAGLRAALRARKAAKKVVSLYHLSVKTVSRSTGRSAVAAAAYRSGERLTNERDGQTHDFTRRSGVDASFIVAPAGSESWALDRATLWNRAESAENRKNSTVAREYELALPAELDAAGREQLARTFAQAVVDRFGVVADVALHQPGREGDQRNHHAHVLTTTRRAGADGLGAKTRELDDQKSGAIEEVRALWAGQVNQALERSGRGERVDHRSHARQDAARGKDARDRIVPPGTHLGPAATALERRAGRDRDRERGRPATAVEQMRDRRTRVSDRGQFVQVRAADHLDITTARHAVREAESDHRQAEAAAKVQEARPAPARPTLDPFQAKAVKATEQRRQAMAAENQAKPPAPAEKPQERPETKGEALRRELSGLTDQALSAAAKMPQVEYQRFYQRDMTVDDAARQLSPAYAAAADRLPDLQKGAVKAEETVKHYAGVLDHHQTEGNKRWAELGKWGGFRQWGHKLGLARDQELLKHESLERFATEHLAPAEKARAEVKRELEATEKAAASALTQIRPAAEDLHAKTVERVKVAREVSGERTATNEAVRKAEQERQQAQRRERWAKMTPEQREAARGRAQARREAEEKSQDKGQGR